MNQCHVYTWQTSEERTCFKRRWIVSASDVRNRQTSSSPGCISVYLCIYFLFSKQNFICGWRLLHSNFLASSETQWFLLNEMAPGQHILRLSAPGGVPGFIFFITYEAVLLAFIFLIKRPFISFFMLPWEPLWGPADRPERGDVNWPWPEKGRQTDGIPELSDSLNRPQQRYLFHCFCTFSFRAQWKINMKRPENRQIETEWVILPQQTCWQVKITAWVTLQLSPLHKPAL